jgi:hypothetical protein
MSVELDASHHAGTARSARPITSRSNLDRDLVARTEDRAEISGRILAAVRRQGIHDGFKPGQNRGRDGPPRREQSLKAALSQTATVRARRVLRGLLECLA